MNLTVVSVTRSKGDDENMNSNHVGVIAGMIFLLIGAGVGAFVNDFFGWVFLGGGLLAIVASLLSEHENNH